MVFYCYYKTSLAGTRTLEFETRTEFNQNNKCYDSIISISTRKTSITAPEITESHTLVNIINILSLSLQYLLTRSKVGGGYRNIMRFLPMSRIQHWVKLINHTPNSLVSQTSPLFEMGGVWLARLYP